jgi:hypothetical protein
MGYGLANVESTQEGIVSWKEKEMDADSEAKKILVKQKHSQHEETLARVIKELEYNLEHHAHYMGPESIFAHVKTNAEALLFLCQERKRDRDKRKGDYTKPAADLPPPGSDIA